MNILVGTSGFAHKEWIGKFYPDKIPAKDMLHYYSTRLNTVEINNTFYHMPKLSVLKTWAEQVSPDFLFAFKAPQVITHIKHLKNVTEETEYLFRALSTLDKKLGPLLFQFPKSFRANRPVLENYLQLIPGAVSCAFDFRSPTWLEEGIPDLLRDKGISWCIEDTDENPIQEIISTAPWGYLRLRRSDYTDADLTQWMEKILSQTWDRAFVFFKHEGEALGAELAMRFQKLVDSRLTSNGSKTGLSKAG